MIAKNRILPFRHHGATTFEQTILVSRTMTEEWCVELAFFLTNTNHTRKSSLSRAQRNFDEVVFLPFVLVDHALGNDTAA